MGAVVTGLTLGGNGVHHSPTKPKSNSKLCLLKKEAYPLVMDTKLKIIEILQVIHV